MLRLQIVGQCTLFPKKNKSARMEKLSKPPQRMSKLASFDTVLAVRQEQHRSCRTQAVIFFFLQRICPCRVLSSQPSHLTPDGAKQHRPSIQQKNLQTALKVTWECVEVDRMSSVRPLLALVLSPCFPPVNIQLSDSYSSGFEFVCRWYFFFVFLVWIRCPRPIFPSPNSLSAPYVPLTASFQRQSPRPGTTSLFFSQSRSALNTQ